MNDMPVRKIETSIAIVQIAVTKPVLIENKISVLMIESVPFMPVRERCNSTTKESAMTTSITVASDIEPIAHLFFDENSAYV